jgi:hypothetical protein
MFISGTCWFWVPFQNGLFFFCLGFYMVSHTDVRQYIDEFKIKFRVLFIYFDIPFPDFFYWCFQIFALKIFLFSFISLLIVIICENIYHPRNIPELGFPSARVIGLFSLVY